jgi:Uma2 family endonuclease
MDMSTGTLVSLDEYLNTSYSPDMEYRDGVLLERNVGEKAHARLQALLGRYIGNREEEWAVEVYTELRSKVRDQWYPIPDVCVYSQPGFEGAYPSVPPLLWIEILSPDDRMSDVWSKAQELIKNGIPYVWIIEPHSLESELWTAAGVEKLADKTLRLPKTPIVIPLADVMPKRS